MKEPCDKWRGVLSFNFVISVPPFGGSVATGVSVSSETPRE